MKRIIYLLVLISPFINTSSNLAAQTGLLSLQVMFEDAVNPASYLRTGSLVPASDGGYYQVGTLGDGEFARALVSKLDVNYNVEWAYRLNFTLNEGGSWQASYGADVMELEDGSILLLCAANMALLSNSPVFQNLDYTIVKFTPGAEPDIELAHCFGASFADIPHEIKTTKDGGYIISGYSNSEQALNAPSVVLTYLVKLNENFEQEWQQRLRPNTGECRTDGFTLYNQGMLRRSVAETEDGGYLFTAQCDDFTYFGKVASDGTFLWSKRFESAGGILEGQVNDDWGFILGAGGGGTLTAVQELDNGNLAFMGNQIYFFFSALGVFLEDPQGGGDGVSLPMSYIFVTNSAGDYLYGTAFFYESGQQNLPIELVADDFKAIEEDRFLVAGGIDRFVQNNIYSYTPVVFEVAANTADFNEGLSQMYKLRSESGENHHRQRKNDYPWGLDPIRLNSNPVDDKLVLTYDNQLLQLNEVSQLGMFVNCVEPVAGSRLYSFPFSLNLQNFAFSSTSLMNFPVVINSLSARTISTLQNCSEWYVATNEVMEESDDPYLMATLTNQNFQLSTSPNWHGATVMLVSSAGQVVYQNQVRGNLTEIPTLDLPSGIYFIQLKVAAKRTVLRGMLMN